MDRQTYELLVEGEALYLSPGTVFSSEAAETPNQLLHLVSYEWACAMLGAFGRPEVRVVDVASGSGYGSAMLARAPAVTSVTGVDASPRQIAFAEKHYPHPKLRFVWGDAMKLGEHVAPESVDVVVSFQTIEHLADPVLFLSEVNRGLTSDGLLLLSTPSHEEMVFFPPSNACHLMEYSTAALVELLEFFFWEVRLYAEVEQRHALEQFTRRIPYGMPIAAADFVTAAHPRQDLLPGEIEHFRIRFLTRQWQACLEALQHRALEARKAQHFLTPCYQFLDLEEGFHQAELPGIWTKSDASFVITAPAGGTRARFTLLPAAQDISEADPLTVVITEPQGTVQEVRFTQRRRAQAEVTCAAGRNRIGLSVSRVWRPADHAQTSDIRLLGVQLAGFELVPPR